MATQFDIKSSDADVNSSVRHPIDLEDFQEPQPGDGEHEVHIPKKFFFILAATTLTLFLVAVVYSVDTGHSEDDPSVHRHDYDAEGHIDKTRFATNPLAAARDHTCVLLGNSREHTRLKCWGLNDYNSPLGYGDLKSRVLQPGMVFWNLSQNDGDDLQRAPDVDFGRQKDGTRERPQEVYCGLYHCCVLLEDGNVKCWGGNDKGELGLGDKLTRGGTHNQMGDFLPHVDLGRQQRAIDVQCGNWHTCVILESNDVKCWGDNDNGELGIGDTDVRGDKPNTMGDFLPPVKLGSGRKAKKLSVQSYPCVVLDNQEVKCWGWNDWGAGGHGDSSHRGTDAGHMGDNLAPINFGKGAKVESVCVGNTHSCVVLVGGKVKCWGLGVAPSQHRDDGHGALGYQDATDRGGSPGTMGDHLPTINLGTHEAKSLEAKSVVIGIQHTCVLLEFNVVKCFGAGGYGGLGLGDDKDRGVHEKSMGDWLPALKLGITATPVRLESGFKHTCAVFSNKRIKCWGTFDSHTGGHETSNHPAAGLKFTFRSNVGNMHGQMGDHLPFLQFDTGDQVYVDV